MSNPTRRSRETEFLESQACAARAGAWDALQAAGGALRRAVDPRIMVKHRPGVAAATVAVGGLAAVGIGRAALAPRRALGVLAGAARVVRDVFLIAALASAGRYGVSGGARWAPLLHTAARACWRRPADGGERNLAPGPH